VANLGVSPEVLAIEMASIPESRLRELEQQEKLAEAIKDRSAKLTSLYQQIEKQKAEVRELSKQCDTVQEELRRLEVFGLPKPDPQMSLDFGA
jgi:predicted transcriptional regulator